MCSKPVGTYSVGKLCVVYEISSEVLPTAPSPTTTTLRFFFSTACAAADSVVLPASSALIRSRFLLRPENSVFFCFPCSVSFPSNSLIASLLHFCVSLRQFYSESVLGLCFWRSPHLQPVDVPFITNTSTQHDNNTLITLPFKKRISFIRKEKDVCITSLQIVLRPLPLRSQAR